MNWLERAILAVAPEAAAKRARARRIAMHYDAAVLDPRTAHRRASGSDADAANQQRARLAGLARDMIRNTPYAARAQQVIANNVVGDGIIPRISGVPESLAREGLDLVEAVLDATAIDYDQRQNLYGLQRIVMNAVVDAGEALIVHRGTWAGDLRLQVLEPDYLDSSRDGLPGELGGWVHDGIEYDRSGKRVGYWLYDQHPGAAMLRPDLALQSHFVPADRVAHIYRQDRPGQMRGVSWYSSIMLPLQDLGDYHDAELMRHKVAATFAGFRRLGDLAQNGPGQSDPLSELRPGLIQDIGPDEEVTFPTPPVAGDFDPFSRAVLRSVAAGLGITYEALTGDLSNVNFSSARMGRVEMDRNVSSWQWTMLIPQMMDPIGKWFRAAWAAQDMRNNLAITGARIEWQPPHRVLVDPTREIPALVEAIRAGLTSRRAVVRSQGFDPERLERDIAEENRTADALRLRFESDYRHALAQKGEKPAEDGKSKDEDDE
jgi:lambda family phage portal protein